MLDAAELAGFYTAHAVWSVSDGETLVPILARVAADGQRSMQRLEDDEMEKAVATGARLLDANPERALAAALVYDGFVTLQDGKTDALIVEIRSYAGGSSLQVVVPYRHAGHEQGFAVHRPKFTSYQGPEVDFDAVGQSFFTGVDQHKEGADVWNKYVEESR